MVEVSVRIYADADTFDGGRQIVERTLANATPDVQDFVILPVKAPLVGSVQKCLVCALNKPWGIFDTLTGATVCAECRDKARR